MFKEKPFNVMLFSSIVLICTAVLQYINPGYSFFDSGLIVSVLLTIFLKSNYYTYIFGMLSLVLILVSGFYPHEEMAREQIIMQHLFSGSVILLATIAVVYVKKLYGTMETDQQQVSALFENSNEGILLTNEKGEIILVNPAACRLFKYDRIELVGKKIEVLIPRRIHEGHTRHRASFYQSPSNRTMGHGRDLYALDKEGKEFPVEVSLSHYRMNNELYVMAFVVDITQRKESERNMILQRQQLEKVSDDIRKLNIELEAKVEERTLILKEALHELEQSQEDLSEALSKERELSEIKSRFVSMASHEFRTPLSSVLSSAALLSRYTKSEEQDKRDRHINRIRDSVKHLNDLLEDFLSLGKLEEGKVETKVEIFNIREFLEEVADEMKTILKVGQEIQVQCDDCENFSTDKRLLKNILINLVSNSIKFSAESLIIRIRAVCHPNELELCVKDEGIGISEEDQQHLFTSFYRGKNAVNIQGTGLGLHIVKRYVDLLKGTIRLQSELGKGTSISLHLPFLDQEIAEQST